MHIEIWKYYATGAPFSMLKLYIIIAAIKDADISTMATWGLIFISLIVRFSGRQFPSGHEGGLVYHFCENLAPVRCLLSRCVLENEPVKASLWTILSEEGRILDCRFNIRHHASDFCTRF